MSLRVQLVLLQALIVCLTTATTGLVAGAIQEQSIRDSYEDRMEAVALSVARLPAITDAFDDADPAAVVQPIAEVIRKASDVTYVVVTDAEGIRYSHPNPELIGQQVSTDPSVPLSGEIFVGTQTGTLGESWRVKVPIYDETTGTVIGTASVGILESELSADFLDNVVWIVAAVAGSAILGVFGATWVTAVIRRRIYRLEPREIASLVSNRETTLHRLSEGVVAVDERGVVTLVNDAAERLLDARAEDLTGRPADEALPEALAHVLERGESEGQLVLAGERVLVARSTGTRAGGDAVEATLLLRDHTELHGLLQRLDGVASVATGLRAQAHEFANTMHVVQGLLEIGLVEEARAFIARATPGGAVGLPSGAAALGDTELTVLLAVKVALARELGIELTVEVGEDAEASDVGPAFGGDLLTVVGNLVDNALEACGLGDTVVVRVDVAAGSVHVTVDDSGPGVPADRREHVFTEGVSSKTTEADGGAHRRGIGLALVRRVVARRLGHVRIVESDLGGARFEVDVPVPPPAAADQTRADVSATDPVGTTP